MLRRAWQPVADFDAASCERNTGSAPASPSSSPSAAAARPLARMVSRRTALPWGERASSPGCSTQSVCIAGRAVLSNSLLRCSGAFLETAPAGKGEASRHGAEGGRPPSTCMCICGQPRLAAARQGTAARLAFGTARCRRLARCRAIGLANDGQLLRGEVATAARCEQLQQRQAALWLQRERQQLGLQLPQHRLGQQNGVVDECEGGAQHERAVHVLGRSHHEALERLEHHLTVLAVAVTQARARDARAVTGVHDVDGCVSHRVDEFRALLSLQLEDSKVAVPLRRREASAEALEAWAQPGPVSRIASGCMRRAAPPRRIGASRPGRAAQGR